LAEKIDMIRPWNELSEEERATEARGMEIYAGMVDALDYHYGRVVQFLKDIDKYDNTIIIFLSDNGANPWYSQDYPDATTPEFADQFDNSFENLGHPRSNWAYGIGFANGSVGPLDKFKMTVGEGGIRVPFIIAGPGIKGGRKTDAFAYVWDVMPTLMEFADAKYPSEFNGKQLEPPRGRSMMPLLDGSKEALYSDDEFIGGEMGGDKWMRQGAYKAVFVNEPYGPGEWRLFNVEEDPGEARDLSAEMSDKLEALKAAWDEYAAEVGVIPPE